jgi:hypothetical protein
MKKLMMALSCFFRENEPEILRAANFVSMVLVTLVAGMLDGIYLAIGFAIAMSVFENRMPNDDPSKTIFPIMFYGLLGVIVAETYILLSAG